LLIDGFYRVMGTLGFTHPLHLVFAYVPVGLVAGAFFFSLGAVLWRKQNLRLSAGHAIVLAFVSVFPAVLFGVFDWMHYYDASPSFAIRMKMILSLALFVLLAAAMVLQGESRARPGVLTGVYSAALACVLALGYFGAELVYHGPTATAPPPKIAAPSFEETSGEQAAAPKAGASGAAAEDLQAGKVIFASNCQGCHAGGGNQVIPSLPLREAKKQLASFEEFAAFVHDPRLPDGSRGPMPAFPANVLSDTQARKLYGYIESMLDDPAWK
jgi:mono/diheme cytochrome c family protein